MNLRHYHPKAGVKFLHGVLEDLNNSFPPVRIFACLFPQVRIAK